ncbi:tRNA-specific 2-thiouridylase MnmA [Spirochaetia bacterium]|nr:tRNA-specific 2-thiouridylase MnmA [Spirochaetia bacterium]
MHNKAVIAMSGGVDSSAAAALMIDRGFECIGITLKLFSGGRCCSLADVNDARAVANTLHIPHYVLNFTEVFQKQVIDRFVRTYLAGATPNPCIDCNRYIKFDGLLLRTEQINFDYLVSGHYACITQDSVSGRYLLKKAADTKKDQSYVLYCLTQDQLAHTIFPLGDMTKAQVRDFAAKRLLSTAQKHDSQDICFVPDGDYGSFIEAYRGKPFESGTIIDESGAVLGRHRGYACYTIGQRRGLGIACKQPVYVSAKSPEHNTVTLGPESSLYRKSLHAQDINLIACANINTPLRVKVKTRYIQEEQWAIAEQTGHDELHINFDAPQRAITPGQAAVLYDGDLVIGGGTITD